MSRNFTSQDGAALLVVVGVVVASFAACNLDDKNPALGNEAPNRGGPQVVPVGAGPGTGGSGAGTGTTTLTSQGGGGPIPANCDCAVAFVTDGQCGVCFAAFCGTDETACDQSPTCANQLSTLQGCADDVCVEGVLNMADPNLIALLNCGCLACGPTGQMACDTPAFTCQ